MPRKGELGKFELKKMPSLQEWRSVSSRYPGGISVQVGQAARAFADCFGTMQPGDMAIMGLPDEKPKQLLGLNAEIKASQAQLETLQASYQRLLMKGPWAMHRSDLFREGIEPLEAYAQALKNHYQRLEYLTIKIVRLREYRDDIEAGLVKKSLEQKEHKGEGANARKITS